MKKSLFSFAILASFIAILASSCSKPSNNNCTPDEDFSVGGYKGQHSILGGAYIFDDSLTITNSTAGDRKISIKSEKLGTTLIGTYDATNCNRVIIDTVRITSQTIETVTLNNIVAIGSGTINGNTLSTVINIKSGSASLGSLSLPIAGQSLTGTFTKQ